MKIIETIKRHANIALALGVMLSMIAAQAIPVFASPSVSAEDAAAVSHLEELYKAYIEEYGDKTTREGLLRVYDSALEINSDSFAKEKAAGYEVKLNAAVLRPIDGSEDKDGEITRGHNGYVNINAEVTKNSKAVGTVSFAQKITAGVKTLTYTRSSAEEASSVWNIGSGKYLNYYNGSADKLIVPEGVEEINWNNRSTWYKGDKTKVKMVIFPINHEKGFGGNPAGLYKSYCGIYSRRLHGARRFGVQRMYILRDMSAFRKTLRQFRRAALQTRLRLRRCIFPQA